MKIINLLPKSRQQELKMERLLRQLLFVIWLSLISVVLVFATQLGAKIYLQQRQANINQEIELLKKQVGREENEEVKKQVAVVNGYIKDFKNLSSGPKWSRVLDAFAPLPPEGVGITAFYIDLPTKKINIQGFASTREKVIELYNRINNDTKNFYDIDYPLENVAKPTDNTFHFTFYIKDDLLK